LEGVIIPSAFVVGLDGVDGQCSSELAAHMVVFSCWGGARLC
jgi:hypothetical protein